MPLKGLAAKVAAAEKKTLRPEFPQYKAGDTVKVHTRIKEGDKERIQVYEGVVIAKNGAGGSKSFTVRKISHGVGVERIFLESSPKVAKLEVVQEGRVRRAKLYYLRGLEGRAAKIEKSDQAAATPTTATK
ncbi:MAG: 50S ribosomal protein L19 [Bdellovibrionales bacterium]|nr:50S ribosomal protein L19 [Bdellovibrionales bacterium]